METNDIKFDNVKHLSYSEYLKMMCTTSPDVPVIMKSLSISFSTNHLKAFLFMKRNFIKWYGKLSHSEQIRIKQYLQIN